MLTGLRECGHWSRDWRYEIFSPRLSVAGGLWNFASLLRGRGENKLFALNQA
jgi:hypothetical protein